MKYHRRKPSRSNVHNTLCEAGSRKDVRSVEERIMDLLRTGSRTRQQITDELSVNPHTTMRSVKRLMFAGWIREETMHGPWKGRGSPPRILHITQFGQNQNAAPRTELADRSSPEKLNDSRQRLSAVNRKLNNIKSTIDEIIFYLNNE